MDCINLSIEFQRGKLLDQKYEEGETPLLACLRAKKQGREMVNTEDRMLEAPTQHSVSTLGSSLGDEGSHYWNDDDDNDSFASFSADDGVFESFDPALLLDDAILDEALAGTNNTSQHHENMARFFDDTINEAIRVASDGGNVPVVEYGDDHEQPDDEALYLDYERKMTNETHVRPDASGYHVATNDDSTFNASISSLNDAFERLNECMDRTSQSRKLVEQELITSSTTCTPTTVQSTRDHLESSANSISRTGGLHSSDSYCSGTTSLSSTGSISSRSSARGPRSYSKHGRQRAWKKGTLSKSGVAPRIINAFRC
jgi:hypothetical protein